MKNTPLYSAVAWLALAANAGAQASDITTFIRQAQDRSSLVRAAQSTVEARLASLASARSSKSPILELAPGVGFANGNTILSQEVDIFGRRSVQARLASVRIQSAELEVLEARASVSLEVLAGFAELLAAIEEVESARAASNSATAVQAAVNKQHEIGEAPRVHVTRAELDVLRASQNLALAEGRQKAAVLAIRSLLGEAAELGGVTWPTGMPTDGAARSFDLLHAELSLSEAGATAQVVRSEFAPTLSAGVATDAWSLDRSAFTGDRFGFQVTLRMPIFDAGQKRGAVRASDHEIRAAQARVGESQRLANLKRAKAQTVLATNGAVAARFEGDVLPKAESMLSAMREGYDRGLVGLVELLEAQQAVVRLRQDRTRANLSLRLAELDLWMSQLTIPGVEVPR